MIRPIPILILFTLAVAAYLPALSTGPFVFDDYQMISFIRGLDADGYARLFISEGGRYFRPVANLSYLIDDYLWSMQPPLMRLVNILLHACNAVLVFLLARTLIESRRGRPEQAAFLAAAVFLVHPLQAESINWICARPEPLAALFALTGVLFFLKAESGHRHVQAWLAALFILTGSFAKEVAFFLFPALLLYQLIKKSPASPGGLRRRAEAALPYATGMVVYLAARSYGIRGVDRGVEKIAGAPAATETTLLETVDAAFSAFGFYLKKLFIPTPLNFAIDRIDSAYLFVGIAVTLLGLLIICRRDLVAALSLILAATIAPAVINAIYKIAWTPFAERYLYLPTALLLLTLLLFCHSIGLPEKAVLLLLSACFLLLLPVTLHRNLLWAEPAGILADSIAQNPENLTLRNNYAIALAASGKLTEASGELYFVLQRDPGDALARFNLAKIAFMQNDAGRARTELKPLYPPAGTQDGRILGLMTEVNEQLLQEGAGPERELRRELIAIYRTRHADDGNPAHLLRAAELALAGDDRQTADRLLNEMRRSGAGNGESLRRAGELSKRLVEPRGT